jgi:hypothetical protein
MAIFQDNHRQIFGGGKIVDRIDKHINSIYRDAESDSKEIQDLKEEMRLHLEQTVKELQENGMNEDDSVRIAIERFGGELQIRNELAQVLKFQRFFAKNILIASMMCLAISLSLLITSHFMLKGFIHRTNEMNAQVKLVENTFEKEGISGVDKALKKLFTEEEKTYLTYVAIKQLPLDYDERSTPPFAGETKYLFPDKDKIRSEYYSNRFGFPMTVNNEKYLIETGIKTSANTDQSQFLKGIAISFFAICWVLWIIWSIINIYRLGKLNTGWCLLVIVTSIVGYLIFRILQNYNNGRLDPLVD